MPKVSLSPANHVKSGFLNNMIVTFTDCGFYRYTHAKDGSELTNPSAIFFAKLIDESGEEHEQWWTCGGLNRVVPSQDGENPAPDGEGGNWLIPASGDLSIGGVNTSTRFAFFQQTLKQNVSFPDSAWDEHGAAVLEGAVALVVQEKPKREDKGEDDEYSGKQTDVVVIKSLTSCPALDAEEEGGSKKSSKGPAKKGPAAKGPAGKSAKGPGATTVKKGPAASKAKAKEEQEEGGEGEGEVEIDGEELSAYVVDAIGGETVAKAAVYTRILKIEELKEDEAKKTAYAKAVMSGGFLDDMVNEGLLEKDGAKYKVA